MGRCALAFVRSESSKSLGTDGVPGCSTPVNLKYGGFQYDSKTTAPAVGGGKFWRGRCRSACALRRERSRPGSNRGIDSGYLAGDHQGGGTRRDFAGLVVVP